MYYRMNVTVIVCLINTNIDKSFPTRGVKGNFCKNVNSELVKVPIGIFSLVLLNRQP